MSANESLFWYNVSIGRDFSYFYNLHSTYTPVFSAMSTNETEQLANEHCSQPDGSVDESCKYDFLRTKSALVAEATLAASTEFSNARTVLGMAQH